MRKSEKTAIEDIAMEAALDALGKSIARWTDKGDQPMTAIPGHHELATDGRNILAQRLKMMRTGGLS